MTVNNVPGLGVDSRGNPVIDPTANVLSLVGAAMERQDDLREAESRRVDELALVRASHSQELAGKESQRIDALASLRETQVANAALEQRNQAAVLATQLDANAAALRSQVEATAKAFAESLEKSQIPIRQDIADLRKVQYEQAGQRAAQSEGHSANQWSITTTLSVIATLISLTAIIFLAIRG